MIILVSLSHIIPSPRYVIIAARLPLTQSWKEMLLYSEGDET